MKERYKYIILFLILIGFFLIYIHFINSVAENVVFSDQIGFVNEFVEPLMEENFSEINLFKFKGVHLPFGYHVYFILNVLLFDLNTLITLNLSAIFLFIFAIQLTIHLLSDEGKIKKPWQYFYFIALYIIIFSLNKRNIILHELGIQHSALLLITFNIAMILNRIIKSSEFNKRNFIMLNILIFGLLFVASISVSLFIIILTSIIFLYKIIVSRNYYYGVPFGVLLITTGLYIYFYLHTTINNVMNESSFNLTSLLNIIKKMYDGFSSFIVHELTVSFFEKFMNRSLLLNFLSVFVIFLIVYSLYLYIKNKIFKKDLLPLFLIFHSIYYLLAVSFGRDSSRAPRYAFYYMFSLIGVLMVLYYVKLNTLGRKRIINTINYILIFLLISMSFYSSFRIYQYKDGIAKYFEIRKSLALTDTIDNDDYKWFLYSSNEPINNAYDLLEKYQLNVYADNEKNSDLIVEDFDCRYAFIFSEDIYYSNSKNSCWSQSESEINISIDPEKINLSSLSITGYIPFTEDELNPDIDEFILQIYLNDIFAYQVSTNKPKNFEILIPIDEILNNNYNSNFINVKFISNDLNQNEESFRLSDISIIIDSNHN
ncbi:MAG: hypothetical protein ACOWWH_01000 [Eubacteriaceae bacterium]